MQVEFGGFGGEIDERHALGQIFPDLLGVGVDPRGVYDDEIVVLAHVVNDQVVDDAAVFVQQEIIAAGAVGLVEDRTRQDAVQRLARSRAENPEFAHVADVEQRNEMAGVLVFRQDAGFVLNRHVPARERDHPRAQFYMFTA